MLLVFFYIYFFFFPYIFTLNKYRNVVYEVIEVFFLLAVRAL
jgi:hypothetical protein